jgi:hypothetical protein
MPVSFIIMSICIIIASYSYPGDEGIFPRLVGVFMLIVAVFLFSTTIIQKTSKVDFKNINGKKVIEVLGVMALYIALFRFIGYLIDTFLLCAYIMTTLGYKKYKLAALFSAAATIVVFAVFKVLLKVPLPLSVFNF